MSMRHWPKGERPREKLLELGPTSLSDAELLAIFFRVGIKGMDAVTLARYCLQESGGLRQLLAMPAHTFVNLRGMGQAKFVQLQAGLELSRRVLLKTLKTSSFFSSIQTAKDFFQIQLAQQEREVFMVAFLSSQYALLKCEVLFSGTIDAAQVYVREVVKAALAQNAAAVVFAHNHPSGSLEPSDADQEITKKLTAALEVVDVKVLDHIIVGHGVVSFAELGLM